MAIVARCFGSLGGSVKSTKSFSINRIRLSIEQIQIANEQGTHALGAQRPPGSLESKTTLALESVKR